MDKKHIGSSLSDFLKDTGRLGQARRVAIKRVLAWQVSRIGKYFIAWASRRKGVRAMSKVFDEIKAGLVDAVIYARGDTSKGRVHTQQKPDEQEVIAYAIKDVLERIERGEEIIHDDPDGMKKIRERVLKEHRETS